MALACCLAGIEDDRVSLLTDALERADAPAPVLVHQIHIAELHRMGPDILVVDIDRLDVDPLEKLRQLRFVLRDSLLVVYSESTDECWARNCHFAGANCLLSKSAALAELTCGLRHAMKSGCWTDPRFAA
jgi:DNA-binding NarL/FixJ family response regulator